MLLVNCFEFLLLVLFECGFALSLGWCNTCIGI